MTPSFLDIIFHPAKFRKRLEEMENLSAEKGHLLDMTQNLLDSKIKEVEELAAKVNTLNDTVNRLKEEVETKEKRIDELNNELKSQQEIEDRLQEFDRKLEAVEKREQRYKEKINDLQSRLLASRAKLARKKEPTLFEENELDIEPSRAYNIKMEQSETSDEKESPAPAKEKDQDNNNVNPNPFDDDDWLMTELPDIR